MTNEQKQRKLTDLEVFVKAVEMSGPEGSERLQRTSGMDLEMAKLLAGNLKRQLSGGPVEARGYHVSRPKKAGSKPLVADKRRAV